jgi:hypothetical protein
MAIYEITNVHDNNDIYDSNNDSNDTNYYDSDSNDSDDNNDNYNDLYEPEEQGDGYSKYSIVLCELYNRNIHGEPKSVSEKIDTHYLLSCRFKTLNIEFIKSIAEFMNREYSRLNGKKLKHSVIKNYQKIIRQPNYIKPEIAECIYLNNNECIAIVKTFWIRLIQRKWKNIYRERQNVLKRRSTYKSLKYREILGRWPSDCCYYPGLRGMLKNLH